MCVCGLLTHTDNDVCNFGLFFLFPRHHWQGIARHVLAKQASRSERAGVFPFIIWRCLAEALGTYGLDMIPGTRFPGGTEATVPGGVFWFPSLHSLALVRLPFNTFLFLGQDNMASTGVGGRTWLFGGRGANKRDDAETWTWRQRRLMMTRPAHNNTHTHKIDWRVRRYRGGGYEI